MAYLITCAGSKQIPSIKNPSRLESLSYSDSLREARENIIEKANINLDWSKTLPAWQLYSGKRSQFYPRISTSNWKLHTIKINILSALFG